MKLFKTLAVSAAVAVASTSGVATAATLDDVKARGELNCVVTTGVPGFAAPNDAGRWEGFDVDFCRATAAAVCHQGLSELLESDDPETLLADDLPYEAVYLLVLERRLHRGEGDLERARKLYNTLRRRLSRVSLEVLPRRADTDGED